MKQIIKARVDYGIDIIARNEARQSSGETRLITWVSDVDRIDIAGIGPVESYASTATGRLEKILSE
jgi:hypothetical protein